LHCTGTVTLKREYNGETIEITFDCQDEAEMDGDDEMEEESELETPAASEEEDDGEGPAMEFGINFDVKITKPSGEKIVIMCVASRNLIVRSVRHLEAGVDIDNTLSYAGPVFEQLNEELQDSFYSYLEERSIGEDLSFFVLSYSRVKEQSEYSNWLNKVMAFAEKK
jgi:complement component 1 Q subcomponent-binding protein, mitochondrial